MFRFFAWHWNPGSPSEAGIAEHLQDMILSLGPRWHRTLQTDHLQVFCTEAQAKGPCARRLANNAGVVLGTLFERSITHEPAKTVESIGAEKSRAIAETNGRALVQKYWGNYVAFVRRSDPVQTFALVSPTGTLPCLAAAIEGVIVWTSCIRVLRALDLVPLRPSLLYLSDRVIGRFEACRSSLEGVTRVHRGECHQVSIDGQLTRTRSCLYWRPLEFAETKDVLEDGEDAALKVREVVRHCTHSLVEAHGRALLRLSGGLDSSIIAGCLREVSQRVTCHTYFDPSSPADVRRWARLAAQHAGLRHIEVAVDPTEMKLQRLTLLHASYDVQALLEHLGRSEFERRLCAETGASAVFTGDGGDSGFCGDTVSYALVEYLRRHGIGGSTLRIAADVALTTHRAAWHVLLRSLRRWILGSRLKDQQAARLGVSRLVNREVLALADHDLQYRHPWFVERDDVPWPTIRRLGSLCHPPHYYDISIELDDFAPEIVHPLYSQPVVETLLRIPLYVHFEGGCDRGLARRAFAAELPKSIAERQWKDRAPGHLSGMVDRHRDWLREMFLDGILVRSKLLDRSAVEAALSGGLSRHAINPAELLRHLDTEIWARQWQR